MSGRGNKTYYRKDTKRPITGEDIYAMVMMHQRARKSIREISRHFSLDPVQVRVIIGKRTGGSCCG